MDSNDLSNLMQNLPTDDNLAFLEFHRRLLEQLGFSSVSKTFFDETGAVTYEEYAAAFLSTYEVDFDLPTGIRTGTLEWGENLIKKIKLFSLEQRMKSLRPPNSGTDEFLQLAPNQKDQIRSYLNRLREAIDATEWPDDKKDYVRKKISELQDAIERAATPLGRAMGLWLDITSAIGKGATNMEPLVELLERVKGVFSDARANQTPENLPAPDETRRLPAPDDDDEGDESQK